jgi:integrase
LLRDAWHGERRGVRSFAEAVVSYLAEQPRSCGRKATLHRLVRALGREPLAAIDQDALTRARAKVLRPSSSPATFARQVIGPVTAVLNHAHRRGWCDAPHFARAREPQGRTRFLLPAEAEALIAASAPHLRPLLIFLLCTGARLSEALGLEWRDVDLAGARAIFWADQTKSGRRRVADLPARAIVSMAGLPQRNGTVFRKPDGRPYATSRERGYGGQIKTGWNSALRRWAYPNVPQGTSRFTPHDLRHSWASWHYALYRDPLALKAEGGWSSLALVERYAHLLPSGQEAAIREFWGLTIEAGERRA